MPSQVARRDRAVAELAAHTPTLPAAEIVDGLTSGLTQLRNLLTRRLHQDVESLLIDSMLAPISGSQAMIQIERASLEIDAYSAVVVADEVTHGGYVQQPGEWLVDWSVQLCTEESHGSALKTFARPYGELPEKDRRLRLASILQRAVPQSIRTPAVLFHLFPLSVRIVAARSFDNTARAEQLRSEQVALLPAIGDCAECDGQVLGHGENCAQCGNPLWTLAWLRVV